MKQTTRILALLLVLVMLFATSACVKGDKGDTGAQGIQGEKGDKGETGAIIEKIEFDDHGRLVITLTDGTVLDPIKILEKGEDIHTYGELIEFGNNQDLTCDKKLYYRVCSSCHEIMFISGTELDHDFATTYSFDKTNHWYACSKCSAVKTEEEHSLDDSGVCTVCKQQIGGVVYVVSADKSFAEVIDYTASSTNVVIADTYKGVTVTKIADSAFEGKSITSVIIPDSIRSIGDNAFKDCGSLKTVVIGENSQLLDIGDNAFCGCEELTSIILPESVTMIGNSAFFGCTKLVEKADGVSYVDNCVVSFDDTLESITLREGTRRVLSCRGSSTLKTISIPDSVTSIGREAFQNCCGLVSVTFGENSQLTSIGVAAFAECGSLISITIPNGVTSMGNWVIANCRSLVIIHFGGTTAQWDAISKGSGWNLNTGTYTVYCTDGNIAK